MTCACNKQKAGTGLAAKRTESAADKAARERREAESNARAAGAPMRGNVQSFSLTANGRTGTFGSRLERDAAAARLGVK